MFGLPDNIDLSPFIGKELTQISMGSYQFQMFFSDGGKTDDVRLSVESSWSLTTDQGSEQAFARGLTDRSEEAAYLTKLLSKLVTKADVLESGTLKLEFDNHWIVKIHEDDIAYESYQFGWGETLVIV